MTLNNVRRLLARAAVGGCAFSILVLPGPAQGCKQSFQRNVTVALGTGAIAEGVNATLGRVSEAFAETATTALQDAYVEYVDWTVFPVFTAQRDVFVK